MKKLLILLSLLFISCNSSEPKPIGCFYYSTKELMFIKEEKCVSFQPSNIYIGIDKSDIYISKDILENSHYSENKLSYLMSDIGVFYFTKNAKTRRVLGFDNGADYFKDGLARTVSKNKKIGYFDTNLDIIIKPKYDFAFPFENKKAIVCNGCKKHREGEHSTMIGGIWGAIDTNGTIIIPLTNSSFMEVYKMISKSPKK